MKTFSYVSIVIAFIVGNSSAQSAWTKRANFPDSRYRVASFSIEDKGYVGTGLTPTGLKNDFWQYNPVGDIWQQKASLPIFGREGAIGFSINGKGYIGCGLSDSIPRHPNDLWEYDPQIDTWSKKANTPINNVSSSNVKAFSINGKGYIYASYNGDNNFYEYDPTTDSWSNKASFPGGNLLAPVAFAIGLKGYIGTGFDAGTIFWEYNPSNNSWNQKADFPGVSRNGAVGFSIGDKGYIGLGISSGTFPQDFWAYDPGTDSWTQIDSCRYPAEGAFAFSIGSRGYVGTGVFDEVGEFWEYFQSASLTKFNITLPYRPFLFQNFPNPFNSSTTISYFLSNSENVALDLFDCIGRKVLCIDNGFRLSGKHAIRLNLDLLPDGMYYCKLKTDSFGSTRELIVLR